MLGKDIKYKVKDRIGKVIGVSVVSDELMGKTLITQVLVRDNILLTINLDIYYGFNRKDDYLFFDNILYSDEVKQALVKVLSKTDE